MPILLCQSGTLTISTSISWCFSRVWCLLSSCSAAASSSASAPYTRPIACPNCKRPLPRCCICLLPLGTLTAGGGSTSAVDGSADWAMWYDASMHDNCMCPIMFLIRFSKVPTLPPWRTPAAYDAMVRNRNAVCRLRMYVHMSQL